MKCTTCNGTGDVIIEKHFCDCPECDGVGEMSCSLSELRSVAESNLDFWNGLFCADPKKHKEGRRNALRLLGMTCRLYREDADES